MRQSGIAPKRRRKDQLALQAAGDDQEAKLAAKPLLLVGFSETET